MLFLLINSVISLNTLNISNEPSLSSLSSNCEPNLEFLNLDAELVNLVAVFRHGDRAPLKIKNNEWNNKTCVTCENDQCNSQSCSEGSITLKGYSQSKKLGEFIKNNYFPLIKKLETIYGFRSQLPRSLTTIRGVYEGLGISGPSPKIEDSIVNTQLTNFFRNFVLKDSKAKSFDYSQFDDLVSSYCSNTAFTCKNCDSFSISKDYSDQMDSFLNSMHLIKNNLITNGISLGDFGNFLKAEILKNNSISLVSGHDSTIIKLLHGLNVPILSIPPYSSSVFIEVWKTGDRKIVRVIYEGKILKVGLYNENLVDLNNFVDYLDMFNIPNNKLKHMHKYGKIHWKSKDNIKEFIEMTKEAYKPVIKEIKKDETLNKTFKLSLLTPVNRLMDYIGFTKQYLIGAIKKGKLIDRSNLFGWFRNNPKDYTQIKKSIEDKNGDITIHTISCAKNGKGSCKTISKVKISKPEEGEENESYKQEKKKIDEEKKKAVEQKKGNSEDKKKKQAEEDKKKKEIEDQNKGNLEEEKKKRKEERRKARKHRKYNKKKEETESTDDSSTYEQECKDCNHKVEPVKIVNTEKCDTAKPKCSKCTEKTACEQEKSCDKKIKETINKPACETSNKSTCESKPDSCSQKPLASAFDKLPGCSTTFETQGCQILNKKVPESFFQPKPSFEVFHPTFQLQPPCNQGFEQCQQSNYTPMNGIFN